MPTTVVRSQNALWLVLLTAACSTPVVSGGIEVHPKYWDPVLAELGYRAPRDLGCERSQVELTLLKRQGKLPVLVAADGCGRSALYSRKLRHHHGRLTEANATWELDTGP